LIFRKLLEVIKRVKPLFLLGLYSQKLVDLVEKNVVSNRYFLIEEALNGVFELLNREFPEINGITCKISKPDILPNCKVSIKNSLRR